MNKTAVGVYDSPIGRLAIRESNGVITEIRLCRGKSEVEHHPSGRTDQAAAEILEYLAGNRRKFSVPVLFKGTDFQKSVWAAIAEIPFGETVTYGELASNIGKQSAVRAVASACGKNPILLIVPCHRVVGKNDIGGFHYGTALKEYLLKQEREECHRI